MCKEPQRTKDLDIKNSCSTRKKEKHNEQTIRPINFSPSVRRIMFIALSKLQVRTILERNTSFVFYNRACSQNITETI